MAGGGGGGASPWEAPSSPPPSQRVSQLWPVRDPQAYSLLHERPTMEYIVTWIDYETVILLFGMMMMVQVP